jgi:hypothetical protein
MRCRAKVRLTGRTASVARRSFRLGAPVSVLFERDPGAVKGEQEGMRAL